MSRILIQESVAYHRKKPYGKLGIKATKPLNDRHDLALAYTPGVAEPCRLISQNPMEAFELTSRSNLIAVVTNGTAVLGLGNIGPLASKPVMEGKVILFKKFAGINAFDIELNETDPDKLVEIITALEPTFGGINLEDIKAPECFYIEKKLKERLKIPVFHDDQHGTAITVSAAILNGLELASKKIEDVRLVTSGAGAAALACIELLIELGLKREHVTLTDSKGVIYKGRPDLADDVKQVYAQNTTHRLLSETIEGADIFLGVSVANVLSQQDVKKMASKPLILALANPDPEILPTFVKQVRDDAIIATGRSDYPNQVNNALCFPYIFRGALDVGATTINQEMKIACVHEIAKLAKAESSDIVSNAYGGEIHSFGPEFIIPTPFDPRLFVELAVAVAKAAMRTNVATRPIEDMEFYRKHLESFIYGSNLVMQPIFAQAKHAQTRIVFVEGEEQRILQAVQMLVDEKIGFPILLGRPKVIHQRIKSLGLRLEEAKDYKIVDPSDDLSYQKYWTTYNQLTIHHGVSPDISKELFRTNTTIIAALMVHLGDADTLLCGAVGHYIDHFQHLQQILGVQDNVNSCATLSVLVIEHQPLFVCGPLAIDPTAKQLVEMVLLSAKQIQRFGITPKVALVSHSNFGSSHSSDSAHEMRVALKMLIQAAPNLEVEGEMQADVALCPGLRKEIFPHSKLEGRANLLIMPTIDAANISLKMVKSLVDELVIGPILMGIRGSAQILSPIMSVREIIDITALAIVDVLEMSKGSATDDLEYRHVV